MSIPKNGKTLLLSANAAWNLVNFRLNLIEALIAAGFSVVAMAPSNREMERQLRAAGCDFHPIEINAKGLSPLDDLAMVAHYRAAMKRYKPFAYLGWTIKPNVYGAFAARLTGVPAILNITGLGTAFLGKAPLQSIAITLYRIGLAKAQTIFFQNGDDCALFLDRGIVSKRQTRLLPGSGVDTDYFRPSRTGGLASGTFLLVARLLGDKGVREFVAAARTLRRKNSQLRFQLLGAVGVENRTAIPQSEVNAWIEEGLIEYHGPVPDIRPFIERADCVVLPSYREGMSRVLLEASAMAKPIIATDVPGCREIVEDGVSGYLCEARDPVSLAAAMRRFTFLTPTERQNMGQAGRATIIARFSQERIVSAYMKALSQAVTPGRNAG